VTATAYSGRNDDGRHLYWKHPGGQLTTKRLGAGYDIKTADSGYVILPPSLHPDTGLPYWWVEPIAPTAEMPPALVEQLRPPPPQAASSNGSSAPPRAGGPNTAYLEKVLTDELEKLRSATQGHRNDTLNEVAFNLGQFVGGGEFAQGDIEQALRQIARDIGLDDAEISKTLRSGLESGIRNPRKAPPPTFQNIPPVTVLPDEIDDFWDARLELAHIHKFARARMVSPWALLGAVLVRILANVPPNVVLPPTVLDVASLNPFVGLVSLSGGGKSGALSVARHPFNLPDVPTVGPGSGEGLARLFVHRDKNTHELVQHETRVIISAPEVQLLDALKGRQSSTLFPMLRAAAMGEALSFAYSDQQKAITVGAHKYRLGLIVGIQPANAATLLDDVAVGTPQRFLWLPAEDPAAPPPDQLPAQPLPWRNPLQAPGVVEVLGESNRQVVMQVCQTAANEIRWARHLTLTGQAADPLDGHALLTQEKVAAGLALLSGRIHEITEEDWQLAGVVRQVSDHTRQRVADILRADKREGNRTRGEAEAERAVMVSDRLTEAEIKRTGQAIMRRLDKTTDWVSHSEVRSFVDKRLRDHFGEAMAELVRLGQAEERFTQGSYGGQQGTEYRKIR
jgi:hypothetical protein